MGRMTRRELLAQIPTAGAVLAVPALAAQASEPSPLRALYFEWQTAKDAYNAKVDVDDKTPEDRAMFDHIERCIDDALLFPAQSAEDFAWKVVFTDDGGDQFSGSVWAAALAGSAYALVGLPIPEGALENLAFFRTWLDGVADPAVVAQVDDFMRARRLAAETQVAVKHIISMEMEPRK